MKNRLRILILSEYTSGNANVIMDFLFSFNAYSKNHCSYVFNCRQVDKNFDFDRYDVILIFWNSWLFSTNELPSPLLHITDRIKSSPSLKVLFLQDEYRHVRQVNAMMDKLGINLMFTCVEEKNHDVFYPKEIIPSLEAVHTVLTGYVPKYMEKPKHFRRLQNSKRPIDIGYRSRSCPYYLGDLAREKQQIAFRFIDICRERKLSSDISVDEGRRLYGRNWLRFLESCRVTLGTESGASVIDFDSSIEQRCREYLVEHPDAAYEEVRELFFADVDGQFAIAAISPRVFEAAAYANTMVMHEGHYSGIILPDVHYIPVRKDYSNIDEVVRKINDHAYCRQLAENAYRDLVASGVWSYQTFIGRFDGIIDQHCPELRRKSEVSPLRQFIDLYVRNYSGMVPCGAGHLTFFLRRPLQIIVQLKYFRDLLGMLTQLRLVKIFLSFIILCLRGESISLIHMLKELRFIKMFISGALRTSEPFVIQMKYDADNKILRATSVANHEDKYKEIQPVKIPSVSGAIHKVVWDHSAMGELVSFRYGKSMATYIVGTRGICEFELLNKYFLEDLLRIFGLKQKL